MPKQVHISLSTIKQTKPAQFMVSKPERLIEDLFDSLKYELRIQIPMMGLISQWEKFCSY